MKNAKQLLAVLGVTSTIAWAGDLNQPMTDVMYGNHIQNQEEDIAMIQTSKKHKLPRLVSMQTAEVLDSYSLGFAGSGNIYKVFKNFSADGIEGSVNLGLGDVVELGFEYSELYNTTSETQGISEGQIKLQALSEGELFPAISVSFSSNLNNNFTRPNGIGEETYQMERQRYKLMMSKNFSVGKYDFSIHPALEMINDEVVSYEGSEFDNATMFTKLNPQLGLTWQKSAETVFILENRLVEISNHKNVDYGEVEYQDGFETNFAIRFYFRNWLMMDAGIRNTNNLETAKNETRIHANFTGVIPLASVGNRILGWVD